MRKKPKMKYHNMAARSSLNFFRRCIIPSAVLRPHNRQLSARFMPFSTFSGKDIVDRVESDLETGQPSTCEFFDPLMPIPDGFPFTIRASSSRLELVRQDNDEYIEHTIHPPGEVKDVKPFMYTRIVRGYWLIELQVLVGSALPVRILSAQFRKGLDHRMQVFEEFLNTKGINAKTANSFFNLYREKARAQEIEKAA